MKRDNDEARRLVASSGKTQAEVATWLSQRLGRPFENYHVSRMTSGSRKIAAEEMDALRELAAGSMIAEAANAPHPPPQAAPRLAHPDPRTLAAVAMAEEIPLYSATGRIGGRLLLDEAHQIASVARHPAQLGSADAFAFLCVGSQVAPRLNHGEIGFACRNRTAVGGQLCVVEMRDGSCLVRFFEGVDDEKVVVTQNNPAKSIEFPIDDVVGLHAVVGATFISSL